MSADARWRESVRRDALAAGMSAATADYLARKVGTDAADSPRHTAAAGRVRAVVAGDVPTPRYVRIDALAKLYGASAAAPALRACGASLKVIAAWMHDAIGSAAKASPAAIERLKIQATTRNTYK